MFSPGEIYLMHDILQECDMAIKLKPTSEDQTLKHEHYVMRTLGSGVGIPRPYWFGQEGYFNAIIFDCLGPSFKTYTSIQGPCSEQGLSLHSCCKWYIQLLVSLCSAHMDCAD